MSDKEPIARSDRLVELRPAFNGSGPLGHFAEIFQIELILDACAIISDLRWYVSEREKSCARTCLLEVLQAETILASAPTYLEHEIEAKLPLIARELSVPLSELESHWEEYRRHITFEECGGPVEVAGDNKDVPYVVLHSRIGAPVLTGDSHIRRMGAKVVTNELVIDLRHYSREAAVEYTLKIMGVGSLLIAGSALDAVERSVKFLWSQLSKVPPVVLLACAGASLAYVASRRPSITSGVVPQTVSTCSGLLGALLRNNLIPLIVMHAQAKEESDLALIRIHIKIQDS